MLAAFLLRDGTTALECQARLEESSHDRSRTDARVVNCRFELLIVKDSFDSRRSIIRATGSAGRG
jgi:hypothetical protein